MEPHEGIADYRRYLLNGISGSSMCCGTSSNTLQITAQGRLDFIPVANETDYLTIPCVPALIEESMSIRFSGMDSAASNEQSMLHHARAIALLNGQMDKYFGKCNTAIRVPIFGSNKLITGFR